MARSLSFEQKESLIKEVQEHEYLYNSNHRSYKDKELRDNAWELIAAKLDITFKQAKTTWTNVRDAYMRNRRNQKTKNGLSSSSKKTYMFAHQMEFLNPYIEQDDKDEAALNISQIRNFYNQEEYEENYVYQFNESDDNEADKESSIPNFSFRPSEKLTDNERDKDSNTPNISFKPLDRITEKGLKRPKDLIDDRIMDYLEGKSKAKEAALTSPQINEIEDGDRLFVLSLLPDIKEMSKRAKTSLKIKFLQVIQEVQDAETQSQV